MDLQSITLPVRWRGLHGHHRITSCRDGVGMVQVDIGNHHYDPFTIIFIQMVIFQNHSIQVRRMIEGCTKGLLVVQQFPADLFPQFF